MTKNAFFIMKRYITNSQCDELPAGLIYVAQLVEHWIQILFNVAQAFISQLCKLCITAMINQVFISYTMLEISSPTAYLISTIFFSVQLSISDRIIKL